MKILALTRYGRLGASSRLRICQYVSELSNRDIHVTVEPLLADSYLEGLYSGKARHIRSRLTGYMKRVVALLKSGRFDLLWVEYELLPWFPAWIERLLVFFDIPFVVDYDDAIFHRYDDHQSTLIRLFLGGKIASVMRCATTVIVGNSYLGKYAKTAGAKRVMVVPTVVDINRYSCLECPIASEPFTIGWIGTPVTFRYMETIKDVLQRFCSDHNAKVVAVGAETTEDWAGGNLECRPWCENTEHNEIMAFNVGIMPVTEDAWSQGKCGYKLIQYMACAKPVIASPVGVNKDLIKNGVNGYLAGTEEQWYQSLRQVFLMEDKGKRMGRLGREKVVNSYSLHVTAPLLADEFHTIVEGRV